MTNAEAIEYIKKNCYGEWCEDDWQEAMDMAIEALKSSERTVETIQSNHIAESGRMVERTAETAQNAQDGDLISRKAAIEAICTEGTRLERNGTTAMVEIKQWCVDILEALPSAQPEREKGRWIDMDDHVMRSCCGAAHYGADKNFCPNCGADMRGTEND